LYQGDARLGSVRTTSGDFVYLNGEPLLPSDCVSYIEPGTTTTVFLQGFGTGYFGHPDDGIPLADKQRGVLARRLLPHSDLPIPWHWDHNLQVYNDTVKDSDHPSFRHYTIGESALPELVLMEENRLVLNIDQLECKEWVHFLDHPSSEGLRDSLLPVEHTHCLRHIAYRSNGPKI
jgi:hypothetical protein